jgi:predicted phosphoribosyltransferase
VQFRNRAEAGRQLAARLTEYEDRFDVVVLALPRGGVAVGFEIATWLEVSLDVFLVQKLVVPEHPHMILGAVAEDGMQVLNHDRIAELAVPPAAVRDAVIRERLSLNGRAASLRGARAPLTVEGRTVILVDDGLATGETMEAAVVSMRRLKPAQIVVAVPVGSPAACDRIRRIVDRLVCLSTQLPFRSIGASYESFPEITDEDVRQWLETAAIAETFSRPNSSRNPP